MLSFKAHAIICGAIFAAMLIIGWGGSILQGTGAIRDPGWLRLPMMILMFGLVIALMYSASPVMVMAVMGFQKTIGNENVPAVAAALKQQRNIIWGLWILLTVGLVVAIPAAIVNGMFDTQKAASQDQSPDAK